MFALELLGALLGHFLPLLDALGALLAVLGRSWGSLGRSWAAPGRSWDPLGPLLGALGRLLGRSWPLLGDLGTTCKNQSKIDTQNDRFWLPKGRPKRAKIEAKTDQNRRQKSMRKKDLFKIVLEPFWSDLGAFWMPS